VGSLLLGLYDDEGALANVGVVGAFPIERRRTLLAELQPLVTTFDRHPWDWAGRQTTLEEPVPVDLAEVLGEGAPGRDGDRPDGGRTEAGPT